MMTPGPSAISRSTTAAGLAAVECLISPFSVIHVDWQAKRLDVALTKEQVKNSPSIDTDRPVSRQHEIAYSGYYGYPYYWGGPFMWGPASYPGGVIRLPRKVDPIPSDSTDSHLRSTNAVTGYHIEATNGELGHLGGFIFDDQAWAIRYIEVATKNWWPGKKVLVSPAWIQRVSWDDSKVYVGLSREAIQSAPEYCRVPADHPRVRKPALRSLRPTAVLAARSRTRVCFIPERRLSSGVGIRPNGCP